MIENPLKIVLVDDDFVLRHILKAFLLNLSRQTKQKMSVFSSANGVEGLGLVYVTEPNIIIIDTTLPKYSGRELLDFLHSNPKYADKCKIILLHEDNTQIARIPNTTLIEKSNRDFIKILISEVTNNNDLELPQKLTRLSNYALRLSNISSIKKRNFEYSNIFRVLFSYIQILLINIINNIILLIVNIRLGRPKDANIQQENEDFNKFRVRYYPTIILLLVSGLISITQVILLFTGSITIYNVKIRPIFAMFDNSVNVNFNASIYNQEEIQFTNGTFELKARDTEPTQTITPTIPPSVEQLDNNPLPEASLEPSLGVNDPTLTPTNEPTSMPTILPIETIIPPDVKGATFITKYSTNKPAIVFTEGVEFSSIQSISEESSINTKESSVFNPEPLDTSNGITYQISTDGLNWMFYEDSNWMTANADYINSNTIQEINKGINNFESNTQLIYFKAFLHSDGETQINLNNISINRSIDVIEQEVEQPIEEDNKDIGTQELIAQAQPVILNAAWSKGNKVVAGRVELPSGVKISDEQLNNI